METLDKLIAWMTGEKSGVKDPELDGMLSEYMKNMPNRAGMQNQSRFVPDGLTVYNDSKTPNMGYITNHSPKDLYINKDKHTDQSSLLGTYFHEATHSDQPFTMKVLQGALNTPGWLTRSVNEFPYYNQNDSNPPTIEKLATMRENAAMTPADKDWFASAMGKDVLDQARKKFGYPTNRSGYTDEQLKKILYGEMFPSRK